MDKKHEVDMLRHGEAADVLADMEAQRAITLLCIVLVVLAFAAPLLVTLPQTLDAVASPVPATAAADTPAARSGRAEANAQSSEARDDAIDQHDLTVWRLRSSD